MTLNKHLLSASVVFVYLLCGCIAGLLFAADKPKKINDFNFVPGEEVRVDVNNKYIGGDHFLVYVPTDYTDEHNWPAIFVYHGMGGQPTTWPFRQITNGKGFIIVGMEYLHRGKAKLTKGEYINYFKRERKSVLEVKRYVCERLKIDEERLFVTGTSKGGWHTSSIFESSTKVWAGAVIIAAGRSRNARLLSSSAGRKALRGKPIYIGAGEKDINLPWAKKAATYYKSLGAEVTFEECEGEGHGFDYTKLKELYNWLVTNSAIENVQSGSLQRSVPQLDKTD